MNQLRKVADAVLNIEIRRSVANTDASGNAIATDKVSFSDDKMLVELIDAPGTGSAFFNTTQSVSVSCPAGTTGNSVTVTVDGRL